MLDSLIQWAYTPIGEAIILSLLCGYGAIPAFIWALGDLLPSFSKDIANLVSFFLAGLAASSLWPQHDAAHHFVVFVAFGFIPPVTYSYALRAAKHFFPWLFKSGTSNGNS